MSIHSIVLAQCYTIDAVVVPVMNIVSYYFRTIVVYFDTVARSVECTSCAPVFVSDTFVISYVFHSFCI